MKLKHWLILAAVVWLAAKYIEANPYAFTQTVYTQPGLEQVNTSQAKLNTAQAAEIDQRIRRQNEMDNGLSINAAARIVSGQGITAAEQLTSTGLLFMAAICGLPWLALFGLWLVWKLTRPMVVRHD